MNSGKENAINTPLKTGDHSELSSTVKPQEFKPSDQKQSEYKSDSAQKKSGMSEPKTDKQYQSDDKSQKDHKSYADKSDVV